MTSTDDWPLEDPEGKPIEAIRGETCARVPSTRTSDDGQDPLLIRETA